MALFWNFIVYCVNITIYFFFSLAHFFPEFFFRYHRRAPLSNKLFVFHEKIKAMDNFDEIGHENCGLATLETNLFAFFMEFSI